MKTTVLVIALLVALVSCEKAPPPSTPALPTGEAFLAVPGGRIWYRSRAQAVERR